MQPPVQAAVTTNGVTLTWTLDHHGLPTDGLIDNEHPISELALAAILVELRRN